MVATRCVITKLSVSTIESRISHDRYAGHDIIIPIIPMIPSNSILPFEFRHLQFPVALCFAMTINKSQGQTFKAVVVDLTNESFTHGMLYAALSRVGSLNCLMPLVREDFKHVMLFIMRFLINCMYCLSAALCTVFWVNGKIFNVCVLVFSKKLKNQKMEKTQKLYVCYLCFRNQEKLFAYIFTYYTCTSMLANEWSMI